MRFYRPHLFLTAALVWAIPGIAITIKGVVAYTLLHPIARLDTYSLYDGTWHYYQIYPHYPF